MFSHPRSILDSVGINAGMHVGDFGTGEGAYARECVKRVGRDGVVYAFDVQKDLIARLASEAKRDKLDNLHPLWVDLDEVGGTTLSDSSLDVVVVANVLFLSEHKEQFLREVARVLRPNARALIVDWSDASGPLGPRADHVVSKNTMRSLAEGAGLSFDKDVDAGEHHYGLLFKKLKSHA